MNQTLKQVIKSIPTVTGLFFIMWWFIIELGDFESYKDAYTDLYWIVPMLGGMLGLFLSKNWNGFKSIMGKVFGLFSLALFAEGLGLLVYSLYYRISGEELAYPSIGDFIFVAGIISFSVGSWFSLRAIAPTKKQLKSPFWHILLSMFLLLVVFFFVWKGFLYEGATDERGGLTTLFNILYPTTQMVYLFICLLAFMKVRTASGGRFYRPVFTLLAGMILLYISDYVFLHQSYEETWEAAGTSDLLYVISYTIIIQSLVYFDAVRARLMNGESK